MASKEEIRRVSIFINGSEADLTLKQLTQGSNKLNNELGRLVPGTEAFRQKLLELQSARRVLQDIRDDVNGVGGAFGWLKTEIGKLGVLAAGFMGFQFITQQFQNIISQNAKFSDSISDIQKTTGMSEAAVRRLQGSFKSIDTRSTRADLNSLAEVAGKLGISGEKDVLGFVRAADQINVALGKDLGNAEQAINDLGKLSEIFHIKDAYGLESALLKTGSAINDLGAAGTANEGYIVEFTKRMGGIAPAAKMSIQDVMGLAATMDELGQPAEAATTAIGQFVVGLGNDIPKFANIAKMSVKDFTNLLATDGNAALIAVLKNLQSTGGGVASLAQSMGLAGEDSAKAVQALGLLSNNLELLDARQKMANASFEKGTSLTNEYNIKNNNFAATLEKLGKKFNALTSNTTLVDWLTSAVTATGKLLDFLNRNIAVIAGLIKIVTAGAVAYAAYNTVLLLTKVTQKEWLEELMESELVTKLVAAAQTAWTVILLVCQGRLREARTAMLEFNAATEANPIGLVIAAITGLIVAIKLFKTEANSAAEIQELLNKVHDKASESIADEKEKLVTLQEVLKSDTALRETKINAVLRLRELMPDHLKGYTDEQILAGKAAASINQYINSLERRAEAEAAFEEMKQLKQQRQVIERDGVDNNVGQYIGVVLSDFFGGPDSGQKLLLENEKKNKTQALKDIDDKLKALKDNFSGDIQKIVANTSGDDPYKFDITTATKSQLDQQLAKDTKALAQLTKGTADYIKVAAEMTAIRKRLKEIDKDTGLGGGSKTDPAKKAAEAYKTLQAQVKELSDKSYADSLAKNDKEIFEAEKKYNTLIDKEKDFLKMKGIKADQRKTTEANIANLEIEKGKDVANIRVKQEKELFDKIRDLRISLGEVYQSELDKETERINKFYDDRLNEAEDDWDVWDEVETSRAKALADAKIREEQRWADAVKQIQAEGTVADADKDKLELARINKKYDDEIEALKHRFMNEAVLTKEHQAAIDLINKNRAAEIKQKDADKAKLHAKEKLDFELNTTKTVSDAVFEIGKNNRQAEADRQVGELEKRKDIELSKKNITEAEKKKINDKYAKQEADIKTRAWEADRLAAEEQAIINGALAIGKALAQVGPLGAFVIPGIIAETAAQVAIIAAQKPPNYYEEGGYSAINYSSPGGYVKRPTLFANSSSGRPFIAGEGNKTEYIISSAQLRNPQVAAFADMIESNRTNRFFENGGYSNNTATAKPTMSIATSAGTGGRSRMDQIEASIAQLHEIVRIESEKQVILNYHRFTDDMQKIANLKAKANA